MKPFLIFLSFLITAGLKAQNDTITPPRIAIVIPLGETVVVEGVSVKFAEVLEDSRCPISVQCIWAGRIRAKVLVSEPGTAIMEKELIFGTVRPGESENRTLCEQATFSIRAVQVGPYPEKPAEKLDYTMFIEKIPLD